MRKLWGVGILLLSHLTSVVSLLPLLWSILGEVIFPYWKFNLDIDFILPPDFPCWCPNVRCARSWIFCILYLPRWCSNVWYAGWHFCILYFCIFAFCIFHVDVQMIDMQAGTFVFCIFVSLYFVFSSLMFKYLVCRLALFYWFPPLPFSWYQIIWYCWYNDNDFYWK